VVDADEGLLQRRSKRLGRARTNTETTSHTLGPKWSCRTLSRPIILTWSTGEGNPVDIRCTYMGPFESFLDGTRL
jgi:hypothetical protein